MRVTRKMINKQLRIRGYLSTLFIRKSSEDKYIKFLHTIKKVTEKRKGKGVKGLHSSQEWLTREDGSKLRLRIYKPLDLNKQVPGVLWLHGGGYSQGIPELYTTTYKRLIEASDCVVVAPDYRLSIEAPYPAALEDAYAALLWMNQQAEELGIRGNQLMVGGESAGGGLTAALTHYVRDKGGVAIAFQMPLYPMIDDRMITESAQYKHAPIWNAQTNEWAWKLYLGDLYKKAVPSYAAPARAIDYSNLPPALTFVGSIEIFRDETIEYVENLKRAGVPVHFELFEGAYHGFDIVNPKADISQKAVTFFSDTFKYAVDHYFTD